MKKFFSIGLGLVAVSPAMAQSSVRVYGVVDQFVQHAKMGGASETGLSDGGVAASRFGFTGQEDLGGGLSASFRLEAGFDADTGAGNLPGPSIAFTRTSTVGVGGHWGRVDAGRMFTPLFNSLAPADPFGINASFSPLNLLSANDGQPGLVRYASRASNMVYYRTPESLPVAAHVAFSSGEAGSAGNHSGDLFGASIGYRSERFYISYALQKTHGGTAAVPQLNPRVSTYQAISGYFNATPTVRLYGNFIHADAGDRAVQDASMANLGASWEVGASEFRVGATRRRVEGSARAQVLWVLGYDYNLSKRTTLYGRMLHLKNRGGSTASLASLPVGEPGSDGTSFGIGVSHRF